METFAYVLYLSIFVIGSGAVLAFLIPVLSETGIAPFAKVFLALMGTGLFGLVWFAFGDSLLYWIFGWFYDFGPTETQSAIEKPSISFFDHPFLWFLHFFAYLPIFLALGASALGSFASGKEKWFGRASTVAMLAVLAGTFYWHSHGMSLLVSWFSWIRGTRKIPTPGKSGGFLLKKRGFRVYFPRYERRKSGYRPRVREIGAPKEEIRETGE